MGEFDAHVAGLKQHRRDLLAEMTALLAGNHPTAQSPEAIEREAERLRNAMSMTDKEIETFCSGPNPDEVP